MKFSTRMKFRMPTSLVDYILSAFDLPENGEWTTVKHGRKGFPSLSPKTSIKVMERMQKAFDKYPINQVKSYRDALQLILEMEAILENGTVKTMKILVDTGAEANLIRKGFVPDHLTFVAKRVLHLVAANGQKIEGGTRTAKTILKFSQEVNGVKMDDTLDFEVEFWEAQIEVDAILSFPWMCEHKIGIFPHHRALAMDQPVFKLLYVRPKNKPKIWSGETGSSD